MSAQEREWQPGDKALIEVEVEIADPLAARVTIADDSGYWVATEALRSVPAGGEVEAAVRLVVESTTLDEEQAREYLTAALEVVRGGVVEAATEDVMRVLAEHGYFINGDMLECDCGWTMDASIEAEEGLPTRRRFELPVVARHRAHVAQEIAAAPGLLAGGVPGRSGAADQLIDLLDDLNTDGRLAYDVYSRLHDLAALITSRVPGRSEAEIRAEVLNEVQAHGVALDKGRGIVCLCGEVCNAVMGRSPARIMGSTSDEYVHINAGTVFAQHLRDVRARVAGTTEAGDDRG